MDPLAFQFDLGGRDELIDRDFTGVDAVDPGDDDEGVTLTGSMALETAARRDLVAPVIQEVLAVPVTREDLAVPGILGDPAICRWARPALNRSSTRPI